MLEYREFVSDKQGRRVDRGARVRAEAVEVLAEAEDPRVVDALVRGLRDDTSYVRLKAIEAVRGRRDDRVLEALAEGVGALPPAPDADGLRGRLHSLDPVRARALDVLLEFADPRAPRRIAAHMIYRSGPEPLTETDEWAFRAAIAALPHGGELELASGIAVLLGHERPEVRARAQAVLRWIGPASVEPLISALQQPHLRALAIPPLGELGDPRAVRPLLDMLSDRTPATRQAAVRALGELRHPGCVEGLMLAAHDEIQGVRAEAIEALDKLGTAAVVVAMHDVFESALIQLQAIAREMAAAPEASSRTPEPARRTVVADEAGTEVAAWSSEGEKHDTPGARDAQPGSAPGTSLPPGAPFPNGEPRRSRASSIRSEVLRRFLSR